MESRLWQRVMELEYGEDWKSELVRRLEEADYEYFRDPKDIDKLLSPDGYVNLRAAVAPLIAHLELESVTDEERDHIADRALAAPAWVPSQSANFAGGAAAAEWRERKCESSQNAGRRATQRGGKEVY